MKMSLENSLIEAVRDRVKIIEDKIQSMDDTFKTFKDEVRLMKSRGADRTEAAKIQSEELLKILAEIASTVGLQEKREWQLLHQQGLPIGSKIGTLSLMLMGK